MYPQNLAGSPEVRAEFSYLEEKLLIYHSFMFMDYSKKPKMESSSSLVFELGSSYTREWVDFVFDKKTTSTME